MRKQIKDNNQLYNLYIKTQTLNEASHEKQQMLTKGIKKLTGTAAVQPQINITKQEGQAKPDSDIMQRAEPVIKGLEKQEDEQLPRKELPDLMDFIKKDQRAVLRTVKDSALTKIDTRQFALYLDLAYISKQPLLIYGQPGIGKSKIVDKYCQDAAKAKGKIYVDWNAVDIETKEKILTDPGKYFTKIDVRSSGLDPTDISGIPWSNSEKLKPYLEMKQMMWIWYMSLKDSDGVLFLDELNLGTTQTLRSFYSVVLDRVAGQTAFSKNWGIVGAGNLGGNEPLPSALTNRFTAGSLMLDLKGWQNWANEPNPELENDELSVEELNKRLKLPPGLTLTYQEMGYIVNYRTRINPYVTMFIDSLDGAIVFGDDDGIDDLSRNPSDPFPSLRQIEKLSKMLDILVFKYHQAKERGEPIDAVDRLSSHNPLSFITSVYNQAAGLCGAPFALQFVTFLENIYNFDIKTLQTTTNLKKESVDNLYALVLFLVGEIRKIIKNIKDGLTEDVATAEVMSAFIAITIALNNEWRAILWKTAANKLNINDRKEFLLYIQQVDLNGKQKTDFKTALDNLEPLLA